MREDGYFKGANRANFVIDRAGRCRPRLLWIVAFYLDPRRQEDAYGPCQLDIVLSKAWRVQHCNESWALVCI